ncbi:MAG: recombinase-like helix-turn-helix domain-containing protein [Actinomycetota bacterium]
MTKPYLEPHQSRIHPPNDFANRLGDAIEVAYAAGIHDLDGLVAHLNRSGPAPADADVWTTDRFVELMAELGQ